MINAINKRKIAILGSTGSIGQNTLAIIRANMQDFEVYALSSAGNNLDLFWQQCEEFQPKYALISNTESDSATSTMLQQQNNSHNYSVATETNKKILSNQLHDSHKNHIDTEHISSPHAAVTANQNEKKSPQIIYGEPNYGDLLNGLDLVMVAVSGFAGVAPAVELAGRVKNLALANKECIVCAWHLISARASGITKIIPVDSEHNSVYQIMETIDHESISGITLMASGGPFWNSKLSLKDITPEMAMNHPKWSMGKKNSIDSATMINKGLELIEACNLFNLSQEMIDIVVHPQAIIHATVGKKNNTQLALCSYPDMKVHISNALYDNCRNTPFGVEQLDLCRVEKMEFFAVDNDKFPSVSLARSIAGKAVSKAIAFNAADEIAIDLFCDGLISFSDIISIVAEAVSSTPEESPQSVQEISAIHDAVQSKILNQFNIKNNNLSN